MMKWTSIIVTSGMALTLGACSSTMSRPAAAPVPMEAKADLKTAANANVGTAVIKQVEGGLQLTVYAQDLPPGEHGVHVHTTGSCVAPDFTSAGGHWNPAGTQHGADNPMGAHAGDAGNLMIASDGRGTKTMMLPGGTFAGLLEGDGSALVIHAGEDDQKTDPSGNSGSRIACGVFHKVEPKN